MNAMITKGYQDVPMTRRRAQLLAEYADKLAEMLENAPDDQDLAEWVQSKIDRAAGAIQSAYHYLDQEDDEDLEKAVGHKYTHRKRVGTDKRGRARYRYYYAEHQGGGITRASFEAGSAFKLTYKGRRGHFHIHHVEGDQVFITHDSRPDMQPVSISKGELRTLLKRQHSKAEQAHVEKRRKEVEKIKSRNVKRGLGLALHRLRQAATQAGVELDERYQRKPKKKKPAQVTDTPREDRFDTMPEVEAPRTKAETARAIHKDLEQAGFKGARIWVVNEGTDKEKARIYIKGKWNGVTSESGYLDIMTRTHYTDAGETEPTRDIGLDLSGAPSLKNNQVIPFLEMLNKHRDLLLDPSLHLEGDRDDNRIERFLDHFSQTDYTKLDPENPLQDHDEKAQALARAKGTDTLSDLAASINNALYSLLRKQVKPVIEENARKIYADKETPTPRNELTETAQQIIEEANQEHEERHEEHQEITRFELGEHTHTRTGQKLFTAKQTERVERDEYFRRVAIAKKYKGRYERRYVRGFVFKSAEDARNFALEVEGDSLEERTLDPDVREQAKSTFHRLSNLVQNLKSWTVMRTQTDSAVYHSATSAVTILKRGGKYFVEIGPVDDRQQLTMGTVAHFLRTSDGRRGFDTARHAAKAAISFMRENDAETVTPHDEHPGADNFETMPEVESAEDRTRGDLKSKQQALDLLRRSEQEDELKGRRRAKGAGAADKALMRAVREILKRPDPTQDLDERDRQRLRDSLFSLEEAQRPSKYMNAQRSKEARQRARATIKEILDQQVRMISEALNPTPISQTPAPEPTTPSTRPANVYGRATKKLVDQALSSEPTDFDPDRSGIDLPTKGDLREMLSQEQRLERAKEDLRSAGAPNFLGQSNPLQDILYALDRYLSGPYVELDQKRLRDMERGLKIALRDSRGEELEQVKDEISRFWREWGGEYKRLQRELVTERTQGEALRNIRPLIPDYVLTPEINQLLDQMERELDQKPVSGRKVSEWIDTRDTNEATRDRQPTTPREQLTETVRELTAPSSPLNIDQANAQDTLTETRTRNPESKAADKALIESARELAKTSERGEEIKSALVDLMNAQQLKRYKRATGDMSARAEDMIEKRRQARERLRSATSGEVINNFETMPETEAQPKKRSGPKLSRYKRALSLAKKAERLDKLKNNRRSKASREADQALIGKAQEILDEDFSNLPEVRDLYRKPSTMWTREEERKVAIFSAMNTLKDSQRANAPSYGGAEKAREERSNARAILEEQAQERVDEEATPEELQAREDREAARDARETAKQEAREAQEARQYQQKTFTPEIQSAIDNLRHPYQKTRVDSFESHFKTRKDGGVFRATLAPKDIAVKITSSLPREINQFIVGKNTLSSEIAAVIEQGLEDRKTPAELKDAIGETVTAYAEDNAVIDKENISSSKAIIELDRNITALTGTGLFDGDSSRREERFRRLPYIGLERLKNDMGDINERIKASVSMGHVFTRRLSERMEKYEASLPNRVRFNSSGPEVITAVYAEAYPTVGDIRENISEIRDELRTMITDGLNGVTRGVANPEVIFNRIKSGYEKATEQKNKDREDHLDRAKKLAQYTDDPQAHLSEVQERERKSAQEISEQLKTNREFADAYIHEAAKIIEDATENTKGELIENLLESRSSYQLKAPIEGRANRKLMARIFNEVFEQVRREIEDEPIERGEKHPRNIANTVKKPSKTPAQFRGDIERADEEKRARKLAEREARRARRTQKSANHLIDYRAQLLQTIERIA